MKLTEKMRMILLEGPKIHGTYKFPDALGHFEEQLTLDELDAVKKFLDWLVGAGFTYGHGNLDLRWKAWKRCEDYL